MNASAIAGLLRRQIASGRFAPHEKLPPQRELAAQFGVARGTLRAALRQLRHEGLLARHPQNGASVVARQSDGFAGLAEIASPIEFIEARMAIEPHMARLAAANASQIDLIELEDEHLWCAASAGVPGGFAAQEEHFHLALARCARNPYIYEIMAMLQRVGGSAKWAKNRAWATGPRDVASHLGEHRAIADAVRAGDAERAGRLMAEHLESAWTALMAMMSAVPAAAEAPAAG